MSDTNDLIRQTFRSEPTAATAGNIDQSPDDAARALELSEASGVPPEAIAGDLEGFEKQHKTQLATDIVKNNSYISDYVMRNSMASRVSNDDYGNLDSVSQALQKIHGASFLSIMGTAAKHFKEGFGDQAVGSWVLNNGLDLNNPLERAGLSAWSVLGAGPEVFLRTISGGIEAAKSIAASTVEQGGLQLGMDPGMAQRMGREAGGMVEMLTTAPMHMIEGPHTMTDAQRSVRLAEVQKLYQQAQKALKAAKPWLDAGKEPPLGVHPEIDQLKIKQSEIDLDNLKEAQKEAQKSLTKERAPALFQDFVENHVGDSKIGVSADAVRKLYGEKLPEAEDNLLGFIPDLGNKLRIAEAAGQDIHVPLADWLTKVDPEVAKALEDDIRVRPGGVTKTEAKELESQPPLPVETPLDAVRNLAGIKTLYDTGERQLTLKKLAPVEDYGTGTKFHDFVLKDEKGQDAIGLNISEQKGGKSLYVEDIRGVGEFGPGDFGPRLMRDVLRQLKEAFPEAQEITGFRVSGAREKAGSWEAKGKVAVKFDEDLDTQLQQMSADGWIDFAKHKLQPLDITKAKSQEVYKAVIDEIDRLVPSGVQADVFKSIETPEGGRVAGTYFYGSDIEPFIAVSLQSPDAVKTARHEVIHHLRQQGFFTEGEWRTLENSAMGNDWVAKHGIDARYPEADALGKVEEAIAEEFAKWQKGGQAPPEVHGIFERLKELLGRIADRLREIFGKDVDYKDLFKQIESGEIGSREPGHSLGGEGVKQSREPELPGMTRMEDRDAFSQAAAIGMNLDEYRRFMKLIEERSKEDYDRALKRAEAEAKRRNTETWKQHEAEVRPEAVENINNRPDVAVDNYFRDGNFFGKQTEPTKLLDSALTKEQVDRLPKAYVSKTGVAPDELAGFFGYHTGDAMIEGLLRYREAQEASKKRPLEFKRQLVDIETARLMEQRYGKLADKVLDEAKEQALSETQLNLLHEETLRLATRAGAEFAIDKETLRKQIRDDFRLQDAASVSSDASLSAAGKAGRAAEQAMLKGDWAEAFRQKQRQYIAVTNASHARLFEEEKASFAKTAKRFESREVSGVLPEYTNAIHDLFARLDIPVKRALDDIADSMRRDGYDNFAGFAEAKEAQLRELHVPEFLLDPAFRKPVDKFTVGEFEDLNKMMKALVFNGRDELKVYKAGEAEDFAKVFDQMKEQLQDLGPPKEYPIDSRGAIETMKNATKSGWWSMINIESMLNRLDRGDPKGVFNQYIVRPITQASNYKDRLIREYQGKISSLGKVPDMDKLVENSMWIDPINGMPMKMRKRNVLGILQHAGNPSNLEKLAGGYGLEPQAVLQWLYQRTTKEDWDRAQKIGDLFAELHEKASVMAHEISGQGIEKLDILPLQTPFGVYDGWYNPVKYDRVRPGRSKALLGESLEEEGFFRATTPQGYTKGRTGYIAPVELNLDVVPMRMKQMINDIAMRPAILQASKFFYNDKFKREMIAQYGQHQAESMIPYLRDIANVANFKSMQEHWGMQVSEFFRQNVVSTLIGFNPGTVMKHGTTALVNSAFQVGGVPFLREMIGMLRDDGTGRSNWSMAMEKSEELQRRMRNFSEIIAGHGSEINVRGARSKFMSYRDFMMSAGATPVSISDMLSSVPTWLARYKEAVARGENEGQAIFEADRAVRQTHGSAATSNKPAAARSQSAIGSWFTSLYSFFSHMLQKQYEMAWMAADSYKDAKAGNFETLREHSPEMLKGFFSYILIPALVEELVTPYSNSEKDSWGVKAGKALAMGMSSSMIGIRDAIRAMINERDPQLGLTGTATKMGTDIFRDLKNPKAMSKERAGILIKDAVTVTGALTGLTNASEARAAQYLQRYLTGQEKPKGPWDVGVGLRYGKTDKHSRTFDDWLKHLKGH